MLSKSLIQFSVAWHGCVHSLLLDLLQADFLSLQSNVAWHGQGRGLTVEAQGPSYRRSKWDTLGRAARNPRCKLRPQNKAQAELPKLEHRTELDKELSGI